MKRFATVFLIFAFSAIAFGQNKQTMKLKLYFGNEKLNPAAQNCSKVFAVTRIVPRSKAVARTALEELFKGPTEQEKSKGYISFFSEETKSILKSVKVKNGAAYINLDGSVIEKLGGATTSCGGAMYEASVEKTLKRFPTIKKLFFAINGDPAVYYDWMQYGKCPKELENCSNKNFK